MRKTIEIKFKILESGGVPIEFERIKARMMQNQKYNSYIAQQFFSINEQLYLNKNNNSQYFLQNMDKKRGAHKSDKQI